MALSVSMVMVIPVLSLFFFFLTAPLPWLPVCKHSLLRSRFIYRILALN
jgi:hypothetical protein